ncbi:MAG: aspartate-semialdehyde dehydrogenase [Planctomycetota bacterium]
MIDPAWDVAVVGATGAVGRELLDLLSDAGHPRERTLCFGRRARSLYRAGRRYDVLPLEKWSRADLAFLCTPSAISFELAPRLAEQGVRVVDLSSAFRMDPEVPLVIPEINGALLDRGPRLVANPNCTTAIAALPLAVLEAAAGLEEVVVVSYQAASGAGRAGLGALKAETRVAAGLARTVRKEESPFPATLALNVIPGVAEPDETGATGEERKIVAELQKILSRPDLLVEATTARVPVERCHSVAVHARLARPLSPDGARTLLRAAPGIALVDDPHGPRPRECAGSDPVHVGRVRAGARGSRSLCFFAVGDQLRKGAALNALQIAARLGARP